LSVVQLAMGEVNVRGQHSVADETEYCRLYQTMHVSRFMLKRQRKSSAPAGKICPENSHDALFPIFLCSPFTTFLVWIVSGISLLPTHRWRVLVSVRKVPSQEHSEAQMVPESAIVSSLSESHSKYNRIISGPIAQNGPGHWIPTKCSEYLSAMTEIIYQLYPVWLWGQQ